MIGFYLTCGLEMPLILQQLKHAGGKKGTFLKAGCIAGEFAVAQIGPHDTASGCGLSVSVNLAL